MRVDVHNMRVLSASLFGTGESLYACIDQGFIKTKCGVCCVRVLLSSLFCVAKTYPLVHSVFFLSFVVSCTSYMQDVQIL